MHSTCMRIVAPRSEGLGCWLHIILVIVSNQKSGQAVSQSVTQCVAGLSKEYYVVHVPHYRITIHLFQKLHLICMSKYLC